MNVNCLITSAFQYNTIAIYKHTSHFSLFVTLLRITEQVGLWSKWPIV